MGGCKGCVCVCAVGVRGVYARGVVGVGSGRRAARPHLGVSKVSYLCVKTHREYVHLDVAGVKFS